jgi:hypothetical protein
MSTVMKFSWSAAETFTEPKREPRGGAVAAETVDSSHGVKTLYISTGPSSFTALTHNRRMALPTGTPGGKVDKSKRRKVWRSPPVPELRMKSVVVLPLTWLGVARFILLSAKT